MALGPDQRENFFWSTPWLFMPPAPCTWPQLALDSPPTYPKHYAEDLPRGNWTGLAKNIIFGNLWVRYSGPERIILQTRLGLSRGFCLFRSNFCNLMADKALGWILSQHGIAGVGRRQKPLPPSARNQDILLKQSGGGTSVRMPRQD